MVLLCVYFFEIFDVAADADQVIDIVVAVQQAGFFIIVDLESFGIAGGREGDGLCLKVDVDGCGRVFLKGGEDLLQEFVTDGHRQEEVVQGIVLKDIREEAADNNIKSGVFDSPGGVFAAGTAAEVLPGYQDLTAV